ncbi:DNA ligase [Trichinella pseudospiralis]
MFTTFVKALVFALLYSCTMVEAAGRECACMFTGQHKFPFNDCLADAMRCYGMTTYQAQYSGQVFGVSYSARIKSENKIQRGKMDWLITILFIVVLGVVLKFGEVQKARRQIRVIAEAVVSFTCGIVAKVMVKVVKNSPTTSIGGGVGVMQEMCEQKVQNSGVDIPGTSSTDRKLQLRMVELSAEARSVEEKLKLLQQSKNWQQRISRSGDQNEKVVFSSASEKAKPSKCKPEPQPHCYIQKSDLKRKKWKKRSAQRTAAAAGKRHEINLAEPQKDEKVKLKSKRDKSNPKTKNLLFQEIQDNDQCEDQHPKEEAKQTTGEAKVGEEQKIKFSSKILKRLKQIKLSKKSKKTAKNTEKTDGSLTASDKFSSRSDSDSSKNLKEVLQQADQMIV